MLLASLVLAGMSMLEWREFVAAEAAAAQRDPVFRQELRQALRFGAEAKIIVKVVDDEGHPVEGAKYHFPLWFQSESRSKYFSGLTDKTGVIVIQGKCTEDIPSWYVKKDGYYPAQGRILIAGNDRKCLKNGKWLPYGEEKVVTLKRIRDPKQMYVYRTEGIFDIPALDKYFGYDLKICDWVKPHGAGETEDVKIMLVDKSARPGERRYALFLKSDREGDGISLIPKDTDSQLCSPYRVPNDCVFESQCEFDINLGGLNTVNGMPKSDMLIIKSRTHEVKDGAVVVNYSKIYDLFIQPHMPKDPKTNIPHRAYAIIIESFFNPEPNDRNLECDGQKNLHQGWFRMYKLPTMSR